MIRELSIIIVNWNNAEYTRNCIESILKYSFNIDYEIILIDNGSTEKESIKYFNECFDKYKNNEDFQIIKTGFNYGFSGGNNVGIKKANGKIILLLNNDTLILEKNWFEKVRKLFDSDYHIGIVGASGGYHDSNFNFIKNFVPKQEQEVEYCEGWAMFIKKQTINRIGMLDEDFFLLCEDSEYCFRAKKFGYKVMALPLPIKHFGSKSLQKSEHSIRIIVKESTELLRKKVSFPIIREKSKNILFIRYDARGDVFLTTPTIAKLRKIYPNYFFHFLTLPCCVESLKNNFNIDKIWVRQDLKRMMKIKFQKAYCFQDSRKYSEDLKFLCIEEIVENNNVYMQNTKESQFLRTKDKKRYIDIFADIANIKLEKEEAHLYFDYEKKSTDIYNFSYKYIALSIDSGWKSRHLGIDWAQEFINICKENKINVILLGTDKAMQKINNCINLIGKTTLEQAARIIENSLFFLTIDSFLLHIAQALKKKIPLFCIFTSTSKNYVITEPYVKTFSSTLSCSPCFDGFCKEKEDVACLKELNPKYIFLKILEEIPLNQLQSEEIFINNKINTHIAKELEQEKTYQNFDIEEDFAKKIWSLLDNFDFKWMTKRGNFFSDTYNSFILLAEKNDWRIEILSQAQEKKKYDLMIVNNFEKNNSSFLRKKGILLSINRQKIDIKKSTEYNIVYENFFSNKYFIQILRKN